VVLIRKWKDEPFFLQISHYAVHTPIQAIPEVAATCEDTPGRRPRRMRSTPLWSSRWTMRWGGSSTCSRSSGSRKGRPPSSPATTADSTLAWAIPPTTHPGYACEGSIRVPFLVRLPGRIAAGAVGDAPVTSIDIVPTFPDLAGFEAPCGRPLHGIKPRSVKKQIPISSVFEHATNAN